MPTSARPANRSSHADKRVMPSSIPSTGWTIFCGWKKNAWQKIQLHCQYYVVTADKSTIWLPVDEAGVSRTADRTHKRDLDQYRRVLPKPPDGARLRSPQTAAGNSRTGETRLIPEPVRSGARFIGVGLAQAAGRERFIGAEAVAGQPVPRVGGGGKYLDPEATAEIQALLLAASQTHKV